MTGVSTDIAPLVVGMDRKVETHEFCEGGFIIPQHASEIGRPIFTRVYAPNLGGIKGCGKWVWLVKVVYCMSNPIQLLTPILSATLTHFPIPV